MNERWIAAWQNAATRAAIMEGGGMRGVFSLGAWLGFDLLRLRPPHRVYAASAGAIAAAYCLAGTPERAVQLYLDHLAGARFISFRRPTRVMDLDYLFERIRTEAPIDFHRLRDSETRLLVIVTRAQDGTTHAVDLGASDEPMVVLKASAALPGFYRRTVTIGGEAYFDGGVEGLPWHRAEADGALAGVAMLTRPIEYRSHAPGALDVAWNRLWLGHLPRSGRRAFQGRWLNANDARRALGSAAGERNPWLTIAPAAADPAMGRLETNRSALASGIRSGAGKALEAALGPEASWSEAVRLRFADLVARHGLQAS